MDDITPMLRQYREIKEQYRDAILFFRLGDFYEMFYEDAEVASRVLEIALTARDAGNNKRAPMCGVPYHAADTYIAKLLDKGYRVAICEQVEDPRKAKGIVRREVVRVVTPGTVIDPKLLAEKQNNYIISLAGRESRIGLAYCDLSTGEFAITEMKGKRNLLRVLDELNRLQPAEAFLPPDWMEDGRLKAFLENEVVSAVTAGQEVNFEYRRAYQVLLDHFRVASLRGYGCDEMVEGIRAGGALLSYLRETQKGNLSHIVKIRTYHVEENMALDMATVRNLELFQRLGDGNKKGSLLWVLDSTSTAMGGRLLRTWLERPLIEEAAIRERLEAVRFFYNDSFLRAELLDLLKQVVDLERLTSRLAYGNANARDLKALSRSLSIVPELKRLLGKTWSKLVERILVQLQPLTDLVLLIDRSLVDDPPISVTEGGLIREGFNSEVDRLREAGRNGKKWIAELEARERERTGIKSLKVGFNRVFGYYLEVTRANLNQVPADYIRKQTLANAERFITAELKEREDLILGAEERLASLEYELFESVRQEAAKNIPFIQENAMALAQLDVLASLAEVARQNSYVEPEIHSGDEIYIKNGRHPVLEKVLGPGKFVPNDTRINKEERVLIITGPNMAGKSTYMRQIALIVLMAQIGSFVPAEEAKIGVVDRVFTRIGARDDLTTGQSTFMVEMNEVANILNNATERSLVILDEIGRGTSTFDGLAIAWATVEYIHDRRRVGAKTLFATHYRELIQLEELLPGVRNYRVALMEQEDEIIFLRKIMRGGADASYGIQVARMAGLPQEVVRRATEILNELEASGHEQKARREVAVGRERRAAYDQLTFLTGYHPLLDEIRALNLLEVTPLQALTLLFTWQDRLKREGK